ncbi:Trp family transcriptional regulator [Vibrio sp. M60_M31a]
MSHEPEYTDWQQILELIRTSVDSQQHEMFLTMLMTPDERDSLIARVNILNELLKERVISTSDQPDAGRGHCNHHTRLK